LITVRPPRGEELQQHQLHGRAYLLLADGEMEISQDSSCAARGSGRSSHSEPNEG
jgi:hypothetical protein